MSDLQNAISEITYITKRFPKKAFEVITANPKEAIPYLRSAIEKALEEKMDLEDDYQIHFYALFLLGEFEDREFFLKIMEFISLPGEVLEYLIGDAVTSGLNDVVYHTYNGDLELLKSTVMNDDVDEYVRSEVLETMGQLYLDGELKEEEWKAFIKEYVHSGKEYNYLYDSLANVICRCHLADMLPEIRFMVDEGLVDEASMGGYESCVDYMFTYRDYESRFCSPSLKAADSLKNWAMFEPDLDEAGNDRGSMDLEKLTKELMKKGTEQAVSRKIGRNDPCPCGSGKKYKYCCLNKPKDLIDSIESVQERNKCLEDYPEVGKEKQEGRIYLEDYFDSESIEIDKLLYLGLMNRPGFVWQRDEKAEEKRCREYLKLAYQKFTDKVKKEGIKTFEEYDGKFSIHYFCGEWTGRLLSLLQKNGESALYAEVKKCRKNML